MRALIEDGIQRILADHVTPQVLALGRQGQWAGAVWQLLEEGGFTRAACSAAQGGSDASCADVHPLLVACGYHGLPLPLPETLVASWLLEQAGLDVPEGAITLADPLASAPLRLQRVGDGWRIHGEVAHVPWGRHCAHLVLQAWHAGECHLVIVESRALSWQPGANLAREPRDGLRLLDVQPLQVARWPLAGAAPAGSSIRLYGAWLRAGQTAGAVQRALELAIRYVGEREQFGRPLAKFQAVQQQLAGAVSEGAAVSAAADHASHGAHQAGAAAAIAVAKITAAEAAGKVAAVTHAVHGAIGFTAEHALHHATQRLWSWRSEFGNLRWWSERLGLALCQQGAATAWYALADGTLPVATHPPEPA